MVHGEPEHARSNCAGPSCALYDAGAAAFNAGDVAVAKKNFEAILALSPTDQAPRATWAAFMLCRMGEIGEGGACATVRALASQGVPDPLGLAAASLGAEAKVHLEAGDVVGAIEGYALEAVIGDSASATESLAIVARGILDAARAAPHDARLAALKSPITQRLVASYAINRLLAPSPELDHAVGLLVAQAPSLEAWSDRAAAAAYRQGRYDDAKTLVSASPETPLGLWVRAKLALRDGQLDDAAALMRVAAQSFPAVDDTTRLAVVGTEGVLAIERGDYALAFDRLYAGGSWLDAAYIADRVLTVDELKGIVDARPVTTATERLRHLLARRLMRHGRSAEAIHYFPEPMRERAQRFAAAVAAGSHVEEGVINVEVATALSEAALLARSDGLELFGTEAGPDYAIYGGSFDGFDVSATTDDERTRVAASAPTPNRRFHYRFSAVSLLEHAAAHTPPRSQAYAALLCQATQYAGDDPDELRRLWFVYVDHGAAVDFTHAFGSSVNSCPPPDFAAARDGRISGAPVLPLGLMFASIAGVVVVVVGFMAFVRRRRTGGEHSVAS